MNDFRNQVYLISIKVISDMRDVFDLFFFFCKYRMWGNDWTCVGEFLNGSYFYLNPPPFLIFKKKTHSVFFREKKMMRKKESEIDFYVFVCVREKQPNHPSPLSFFPSLSTILIEEKLNN